MEGRTQIWRLTLWAVCIIPALAGAEQYSESGPYTVHYNAFTTATLTEQAARSYGIVRSQNRAMLNIAVLKDVATDGRGQAVSARITATAVNLSGQLRQLQMRELAQGDAIYYIAEMPITNQETYNYQLSVLPSGAEQAIELQFTRQFFID